MNNPSASPSASWRGRAWPASCSSSPPIVELPPLWQVGLAFLAWIGWCYWRGLFGQYRLSVAALESIPSLWLSLKWTNLLVIASALAAT